MSVAMRATRIDRGVKRRCAGCDTPFYDLARDPIQCPKCGTTFNADAPSSAGSAKRFKASVSRTRARIAPTPVAKTEESKRAKAKDDEVEADEDEDGDDLILDDEDDEN